MKSSAGTFYGEVLKTDQEYFLYLELPTFSFSGNLYRVYPDIGAMTWQHAMDACGDLTYGGFTDWYLPSQEELRAMYENKSSIGGFSGTYYWSSTECRDGAYYWRFGDDDFYSSNYYSKSHTYRVRCIRKEN